MSIFPDFLTQQWAKSIKSSGRQNGFHLEPKCACKGNQPSPHALRPDMFAILTPQTRWYRVRTHPSDRFSPNE